MAEGHLIHRFALDHERAFAGDRLRVTSPHGRFGAVAQRLYGRRLDRVEAYGKHLFYWFDGAVVLHVHLGLGGTFRGPRADAPPVRQAALRIAGERLSADLIGPRTCELVTPPRHGEIVAALGPDPLRDGTDLGPVEARIRRSPREIGALLLDQSLISGVGNVIRVEALFAVRIHPAWPGDRLAADAVRSLRAELAAIMRRGVAESRIITVRRRGVPVDKVPERLGRYVYRQRQCRHCGTPVQTWTQAGRTTYACPRDQPPPHGFGPAAAATGYTGQK